MTREQEKLLEYRRLVAAVRVRVEEVLNEARRQGIGVIGPEEYLHTVDPIDVTSIGERRYSLRWRLVYSNYIEGLVIIGLSIQEIEEGFLWWHSRERKLAPFGDSESIRKEIIEWILKNKNRGL